MKPDVIALGHFVDWVPAALAEQFTVHAAQDLSQGASGLGAGVAGRVRGILQEPNRQVTGALIRALPRLEIIACCGTGLDAIDLAAARERGVSVTNTPGLLGDEVADLAMALLLATTRRVVQADRFVRQGGWGSAVLPLGTSIRGKTMGILGLGQIGSAIAARATAFGMHLLYHGPHRKPAVSFPYVPDLVEMAAQSDVLMVACQGGPQTRHLVTGAVLSALGAEGVVVNISRGSVIDELVLIGALQSGALGAAALDVFENEPTVPQALLALPNVVLTPHIGSATLETRTAMARLAIANLAAKFAGQPLPSPVRLD